MEEIVQRLTEFMKAEGLNKSKFAERIGVNPSAITHIYSGRNALTDHVQAKILMAFPNLSYNWFIKGEGDMYSSSTVEESTGTLLFPEKDDSQEDNISTNSDTNATNIQQEPSLEPSVTMEEKSEIVPEIEKEAQQASVDLPTNIEPISQPQTSDSPQNPSAVQSSAESIVSVTRQQEEVVEKKETTCSRKRKQVVKMIFFYEDKTFEVFYPSEDDCF